MTPKQTFKKLFESQQEAAGLIARLASVAISATMKQASDGKYIVTFRI